MSDPTLRRRPQSAADDPLTASPPGASGNACDSNSLSALTHDNVIMLNEEKTPEAEDETKTLTMKPRSKPRPIV